ncbi:MAG: hypothetical protein QXH30_02020 [Candidatus Bilamarchaeaceae archaeon]
MALRCRICGREGFEICPECSFKEMNQQCWRCRMYLPAAEMQQFQGQWICPNCRMDLQEEKKRHGGGSAEHGGAGSGAGGSGEDFTSEERKERLGECERCGRPSEVFYIVGGRKLCKFCFEQGKEYMARGPGASPLRIQIMRRKREKKGLLRRIVEFFLGNPEGPEYEIVEAEVLSPKKEKGKGQGKEEPKKHDWGEHKKE